MSGRRGRRGRESGACRGVLDKARVGFDWKIAGGFRRGRICERVFGMCSCPRGWVIRAADALDHS